MDDKTNVMLTTDPKGGKDAVAWKEDFIIVNKTTLLIKSYQPSLLFVIISQYIENS